MTRRNGIFFLTMLSSENHLLLFSRGQFKFECAHQEAELVLNVPERLGLGGVAMEDSRSIYVIALSRQDLISKRLPHTLLRCTSVAFNL